MREFGAAASTTLPIALTVVATVVFGALAWLAERGLFGRSADRVGSASRRVLAAIGRDRRTLVGVAIGALALRVVVALVSNGHPADVGWFRSWAQAAFDHDLIGVYDAGIGINYPPGYVAVLYALAAVRSALGLAPDGALFTVMLRLPAMVADVGLLLLLAGRGARRASPEVGGALALFVALNPALILNCAVWGQVDAVLTLLVVAALVLLVDGRPTASGALYALAILVKPQALVFGLVFVLALVRDLRDGRSLAPWLRLTGAGAATLVAAILPFAIGREPLWILRLYAATLGAYDLATVNAANLWGLLGGNWRPLSDEALGLSFATWGAVALALIVAGAARLFLARRDSSPHLAVAAVLAATFFLASVRVHERYLFPALALAALAAVDTRDRRFLTVAVLLSVVHSWNVGQAYALARVGDFSIERFNAFFQGTALLHVVVTLVLIRVAHQVLVELPQVRKELVIRRRKENRG